MIQLQELKIFYFLNITKSEIEIKRSMQEAIPYNCNAAMSKMERNTKEICNWLFFQLRVLNLSENMGISEISR